MFRSCRRRCARKREVLSESRMREILRQQRGLKKGSNVRDKMNIVELSAIKLTEALATQRITVEDSRGNTECKEATGRTASNVRFAIDREMQDRQRRLLR